MKQLVAGINARDMGALRPVIHPATLACMRKDDEDYYAWWLWKDGSRRYTIPAQYVAEPQKPIDVRGMEAKLPKDALTAHWPAEPDRGVDIRYKPAPMSIVSRLFEIRMQGGEAKLIMDCPNAAGLAAFRAMRADKLKQRAKLEKLWKALSPEERQPLILLASQGMKLDGLAVAEQKYHLNPEESLAFMDMIQDENNPER